jgi:hypothetical protein
MTVFPATLSGKINGVDAPQSDALTGACRSACRCGVTHKSCHSDIAQDRPVHAEDTPGKILENIPKLALQITRERASAPSMA